MKKRRQALALRVPPPLIQLCPSRFHANAGLEVTGPYPSVLGNNYLHPSMSWSL